MNILALDLATHCGYATSWGESGVWDFSIKKDESKGMRLFKLRSYLQCVQQAYPLQLLVFEAVRHARFSRSSIILAEMQGVIKEFACYYGIEYKGYSPTAIKKHATGRGNADKHAMIRAAKSFFRKGGISSDEADALWLLDLAMKELEIGGENGVVFA